MIPLKRMRDLHEPKMHPEMARRFFAYMEHKGFGVGGGFRATQPVKPGFAPPGKSFHEAQTFASGISAYCAIDLVVAVPGGKHRAPTWDECADAPLYGLHTFVNNEPWHIQPIEIRGHGTWVNAGRPDPKPFTLPGAAPVKNPFVLAGVDTNGTDYNGRCGMIMPGGGSGLILESDLSLRSCQLRGGTVTKGIANPMTYSRPYTKQSHTTFPWTFSGQIKINARAPDGSVWIYGEERAPTWQHGVCFSVWADEDNNAMSCAKPSTNVWGATGQIDGVYGIEYESLYRNRVKYAEVCTEGVWHRFELTAVAPGHHRLFWDGVLMVEAIEKNPAPFWSRELHGECRLDFYDYALMIDAPPVWEIDMREVIYTPPAGSPKGTPWLYQEGGSITYCTSWMHAHATADKVPVEALNAEQYPLARKAAGL